MELNNKRDLPVLSVKQVIERPIRRSNGIKSIKANGAAIKSLDSATAFKTLSSLKRSVVKAQQACQLAEMDLEDMKYGDPSSIQSAGEESPATTESLEAIRDASKLISKASDLIEVAKKAMAPAQPEAMQQAGSVVAANPNTKTPNLGAIRKR